MIKNIIIAVLALVVLGLGVAKLSDNSSLLAGGTTNFDTLSLTGLQVGSSGSSLSQVLSGTLTASSCTGSSTQPIGASVVYDCAVTSVVSGDTVMVSTASSTFPETVNIKSSLASSTSGFIQIVLRNASSTGAFASATTTGFKYLIIR